MMTARANERVFIYDCSIIQLYTKDYMNKCSALSIVCMNVGKSCHVCYLKGHKSCTIRNIKKNK